MKHPLAELTSKFPDEISIRSHLAKLRWNGKVICPVCSSTDILSNPDGYECRDCRRSRQRKNATINTSLFTVMTGTHLEDTRSMKNFVLFLYVWLHLKQPTPASRVARSTGMSRTNCNHHMNRVALLARDAGVKREAKPKLDDALRAFLATREARAPAKLVA
jgi:transposase-like zinc ribbon protein